MIIRKVKTDKGAAEAWKLFDEMHEKMKDEDPQKVEKLIDEAVKETRKQRTAKKAPQAG
jgi:hypothetical protein